MIDIALTSLLREHAGVAKRIQPSTESVRVTEDLPRVVYSFIDLDREYTDDGSTGLVEARYQLDIFADKATEARGIADAIRIGLDGFSGVIDTSKLRDGSGEVRIKRIRFDREGFAKGERVEGANKTVARYSQDVFLTYHERTT